MVQHKPETRSSFAWLTQQILPVCVAIGAVWTLDPQRLVRRDFDIGNFPADVVKNLADEPMLHKTYGEGAQAPSCPGPDCPLNPASIRDLTTAGWTSVPTSHYERVSRTAWRSTYYERIETTLPAFAATPGSVVAFDMLGVAGKTWRMFVNGKEKASGSGGSSGNAVEFVSDGGVAGEPMTIGFEVDSGRTFAPGLVSISQPFLATPGVAPAFRSAYRGVDKEKILPDAFGRMIIAVVAALGCLFTPFHLEILAYGGALALWNYSRMLTNAMAPFPAFLGVDFMTLDSAVRCAFYACLMAFFPLYFRQRRWSAFYPAMFFSALAPVCLLAGRTGFMAGLVPIIIRNHFGIMAVIVLAGSAFAFATASATMKLPHAQFRRNIALLFTALLAFDAFLLAGRQSVMWGWDFFPIFRNLEVAFKVTKTSELILASFGIAIALEWALVVRDRQGVLQRFGMVIDPRVLKEIIHSPHLPTIRADRVIALFVDLRSFSAMCERFSPAEVNLALNEYLDVVTRAVQDHNGIIDKFVGDAVLALWGVPVQSASDPMDSVRAAMAIRKGMNELNRKRAARGDFVLSCGVGLHAGPAIFGPVGNAQRIDFTAIGPTINLSARLQGLTKDFGADTLMSQSLHRLVADKTLCEDMGAVPVRGFDGGAHVVRLLGVADAAGRIHFEDSRLASAGLPTRAGMVEAAPKNLQAVRYQGSGTGTDRENVQTITPVAS